MRDYKAEVNAYASRISNDLIGKTNRDNFNEIFDAVMYGIALTTQPFDAAKMHYMSEVSAIVSEPWITERKRNEYIDQKHLRLFNNCGFDFEPKISPEVLKHIIPWWNVLNVNEHDSEEYIKKTFRKLVNEYHPSNLDTGDLDKFVKIKNAYTEYENTLEK